MPIATVGTLRPLLVSGT